MNIFRKDDAQNCEHFGCKLGLGFGLLLQGNYNDLYLNVLLAPSCGGILKE